MTDFTGLIVFLIFISGVSSYTLLKFKILQNEEIDIFKQRQMIQQANQLALIRSKPSNILNEKFNRDKLIRDTIEQVILSQNQSYKQEKIENYSTIDVYDVDTGKKTKYLKPKSKFFD